MQLGLSTTTVICLFQARSSTYWMFGWRDLDVVVDSHSGADLRSGHLCSGRWGPCHMVLGDPWWKSIKKFALQLPKQDFYSFKLCMVDNVEALLVSGWRGLLAEIRHWPPNLLYITCTAKIHVMKHPFKYYTQRSLHHGRTQGICWKTAEKCRHNLQRHSTKRTDRENDTAMRQVQKIRLQHRRTMYTRWAYN